MNDPDCILFQHLSDEIGIPTDVVKRKLLLCKFAPGGSITDGLVPARRPLQVRLISDMKLVIFLAHPLIGLCFQMALITFLAIWVILKSFQS